MNKSIINFKAQVSKEINIINIDPAIESLLNIKADELIFKKIIHPLDYDIYQELIDLPADQKEHVFRIRLLHVNRSIIITKLTCHKTFDQSLNADVLNGVIEDVTVNSGTVTKEEDACFFAAMMEKTDDYIFFKSRDHLFTAASQTLVALTSEKNWRDLIGKTDYQVFPKDYADVYYSLEKKIFSGEVQIAQEIQETLDNDGNKGWVDNRKYPIRNKHGDIIGLFGIARDITELVTTKNEVKRLNQGLQEQVNDQLNEIREKDIFIIEQNRLAQMGEMAAGVGHEINNPLSISAGNISLIIKELKRSQPDLEKVLKKLDKVEQGHERIRKIVDGLRVYARLDKENIEIISFNQVIDQTLDFISEIYKKEGITINYNNGDQDLLLEANLGKIQQVILNLISNAKDATEGQEKREINLTLNKTSNRNLVFSIHDNGSGIPDEIRDKILDPFFTTKIVGKGTGMGLGFVNENIKSLNGKLKIESTPGNGSTFTITLPLAQSEEE